MVMITAKTPSENAASRSLCVLISYSVIFTGDTVRNYFKGGSEWVVAWEAHRTGDLFEPLNWKRFLIQQTYALSLTIRAVLFRMAASWA